MTHVIKLRGLAALLLPLALACSNAPRLSIDTPADGAKLTPVNDLDPATPGLQVPVSGHTDAADGSLMIAKAGGALAYTTVKAGAYTFPSVTLDKSPEGGTTTLTVSVVDQDSKKGAFITRKLSVDTLTKGCLFVSPDDLSVVTTDPGDTGLVQIPVKVRCAGLSDQDQATVQVLPDEPAQSAFPAFDGTATFTVTLIPGDNLIALTAPNADFQLLRVRLEVDRCRVELANPSGTIFNLDGAIPNSIADRNPNVGGIQARLQAGTDCADGSPASITVTRVGAQSVTAQGTVQGGVATFDLTLPEGPLSAQAFAGAPGKQGASRRESWTADSVRPAITLTTPANGAHLTDADDAQPATAGFQAKLAGTTTNLSAGGTIVLTIDIAGQGRTTLPIVSDGSGSFSQDVTLPAGHHSVTATAIRQSGNAAVSATNGFDVTTNATGAALSFVSPQDGDALGTSKLVPQTGGAQALFSMHVDGLPGASITVTCGASQATGTADANGDASIPVLLAISSCDRRNVSCSATATGTAGSASAGPITLSIDATAPTITMTAPTTGETRSSTVNVLATTSCSGELQSWALTVNGAAAGSGLLSNNQLTVNNVALQPGDNVFSLTVQDEVLNTSAPATATVTLLTGTPQVVITSPLANTVFTGTDDGDPSTPGVQVPVRVQVDNRPVGTVVALTVTSQGTTSSPITATTQSQGGHLVAVFPAVSLSEGADQLVASVTDPVTPAVPPVTASVNVSVNTNGLTCTISSPADHATLTASQDEDTAASGFQKSVSVLTNGDQAAQITLTTPSGGTITAAAPAQSGAGTHTLTASKITLPAEGVYAVAATCNSSTLGVSNAVGTHFTLQLGGGPVLSFTSPINGAILNESNFDANGDASIQVQASGSGASGGSMTLTYDCGNGAHTLAAQTIPANGLVTFLAPLITGGAEASCTLTANGTSSGGVAGLSAQIVVTADRKTPAPVFVTPVDGGLYGPSAPELDCSTPTAPLLRKVDLAIADAVNASGLELTLVNGSGGTTVTNTPSQISGGWRYTNVALLNGASTLSIRASDPAGNSGTAQVTFNVRCVTPTVTLSLAVAGNKLGYTQDKDHSTTGEQIGAAVDVQGQNGAAVRVCSTVNSGAAGSCVTAGTFPVATSPASPTISGTSATFDLTLADGPQTLLAEVTDVVGTTPSTTSTVTVRATPPALTSITLTNDTNNDGALNQAEQDASATLSFKVSIAGNSFVSGQTVQVFSQSIGGALGSAVASGNGPLVVTVPVPLSAVKGTGGVQTHVFYARVVDDAGNPNSIPGAVYPGDTAVTLGTQANPFVIAPAPSITLTAPAAGTTRLLESDDANCISGVCPGVDPLAYALAAQTTAPDSGSTITFVLDGATLGAGVVPSGGAVSNVVRNLANGTSRVLKAHFADTYGNAVDSSALTLLIDSVPPALAFNGQPTPADSFPQSITVTTGTSLEDGQVISVHSDRDGLVGSQAAAGTQTTLTIRLTSTGAHVLTATATDLAGNAGTSTPLAVTQNFSGPTVTFTQPTPTSGTVSFGLSTKDSNNHCAPPLTTASTNATDGTDVSLWIAGAADCSGGPNGTAVTAPLSGGTATFTNLLTFTDGQSGFVCAQITFAAQTQHTAPQQFTCDLTAPAVAFTSPSANQLFVAPPGNLANLPAGAIASKGSNVTVLVADFGLTVTAPAGARIDLFDGASGTPFATQTLSTAASAQAITFPSASLSIPAAQALAHSLTAKVTSPSGNSTTSAALAINVDINPPAVVSPVITQSPNLTGGVHLEIPVVPGDDGTQGGTPSAWSICYSTTTPLSKSNWCTSAAGNPAPIATSTTPPSTGLDVVLPTDFTTLWIGVRAVDRAGNLGDFTAQSAGSPTLSTALTRSAFSVGPVNGIPSGIVAVNPTLRTGDVDGDGLTDVIIAYPYDEPCDTGSGFCDGAIHIYFGTAAGIDTTPLKLRGTIATGALGFNQGFDVGDFDGDGLIDVVASETDAFSTAAVHVWLGKDIATKKATHGTPNRIDLSDAANAQFLGGTVRAVGHATGGAGTGSDLAISNFSQSIGDPSASKTLGVFARGGAWLNGSTSVFSLATFSVALPTGQGNGSVDVAPLDALDASGRTGLFVSFVEVDGSENSVVKDPRAYAGASLIPGSLVPTSAGVFLPAPTGNDDVRRGYIVTGGSDVVGDSKTDLLVADTDSLRVYVYDGSTLLSGTSQPVAILNPEPENGDVGLCATMLPDLDGDGKAEYTGCAASSRKVAAYIGYGFAGSTPPPFAFFGGNPPNWAFGPTRGQKVTGGGVTFAQMVGAGHFKSSSTSTSALQLVVVSHDAPVSGQEQLVLIR
ncbi:MAG: VCBS repeat-containing protein [Deltaproteobacteria bacterium]|nr:VCBS repeat-containing protein [Deltaproteobacteria bacterium]